MKTCGGTVSTSTVDHADIRGLGTALLSSVKWVCPHSRGAHGRELVQHNADADYPRHRSATRRTSSKLSVVWLLDEPSGIPNEPRELTRHGGDDEVGVFAACG